MSTIEEDRPDDGNDGDLLSEQEHRGYGQDEGERDEALDADED